MFPLPGSPARQRTMPMLQKRTLRPSLNQRRIRRKKQLQRQPRNPMGLRSQTRPNGVVAGHLPSLANVELAARPKIDLRTGTHRMRERLNGRSASAPL